MALRLRTRKLISAGLIGASAALAISTTLGFFYYQKTQKDEIALIEKYELEIQEYKSWASQSEVGYALKADVKAGTPITQDMVQQVYLSPLAAPENILHAVIFKSENFARIDLTANTVLTEELIYKESMIERDVREVEYSFIELPTRLSGNQFVDVRIQFPNGDDYVLLSKKKTTDVDSMTVWLNLDEGEILSMSSATVDAYIEGAKIYALPYVDGDVQIGAELTYPVKQNVLELIKESPNIVNIAKLNLEKQNRERLETYLTQMEEGEVQRVKEGESATKTEVEQKRAEDRINAINQQNEERQYDLIGGGEDEE